MYDEQTEFAISQYADGTLPGPERFALEMRLNQDAKLRELLDEYRKLNNAFAHVPPVPLIAWDRLTDHLSNAIADADRFEEPMRIYAMPWVRRVAGLAIAASVLIVISIGLRNRVEQPSTHVTVRGELFVAGPTPEAASGAAVQEITIGPSPSIAMGDRGGDYGFRYGDSGVVARPPRIVIASGDEAAQDTPTPLY